MNKKSVFIIALAAVLLCAVLIVAFTSGKNGTTAQPNTPVSSWNDGASQTGESDNQSGLPVESGPDPVVDNINKPIIGQSENISGGDIGVTYPLSLEKGALTINRFVKYSGFFTEDLSFDKTTDALAVEIVNTSGKFIEVAVVSFKTPDGQKLSFWVSRLAPGDVTLVQEKNNAKYSPDLSLTPDEVTISYMDKWNTSIIDYLTFNCTTDDEGNNVAVVINNSKKQLKNVKVWYKRNVDDIYIGGYTYILSFDTIAPGETLFIKAKFFNTECIIIDSQYTLQ